MTDRFIDVIHHELAEERAGALGRSGVRLEHALEAYRDYDRSSPRANSAQRERLLWDLVERVESFIVQREACGLRDSRQVLKHYGVPREAIARVGVRRPRELS